MTCASVVVQNSLQKGHWKSENSVNFTGAFGSPVILRFTFGRVRATGVSTGDPNAPVKLTEFSDFQCPFCKEFWTTTEAQVIDAYVATGKVQFTYRSAGNWVSNNVDSQTGANDTESQDAAMAAYCAADQNKFSEMHDALFSNAIGEADGTSFPVLRLPVIAQSISLDMTAFNSCFSGQKYKDQVDQDYKDAVAAGIQGTPFFVISYTFNRHTPNATASVAQPLYSFHHGT